jgi:hypothetical protein
VSGRAWTGLDTFGSFIYFGRDWSGGSGQLDQRSHRASINIGQDWSGGTGKNYVSAGSLQKRGAAAPKNRDVSKVIREGPRKTTSRQAVSRNGAQRCKNRDVSEVIRGGPRKTTSRQAVSRNGWQRLKKTGASVRSLRVVQEKLSLSRKSPETARSGSKKQGRQ